MVSMVLRRTRFGLAERAGADRLRGLSWWIREIWVLWVFSKGAQIPSPSGRSEALAASVACCIDQRSC